MAKFEPRCHPGQRARRRGDELMPDEPRVIVEYAREFIDPLPADAPVLWDTEFHGDPDLSQPPPSASRPHPMRWVTRTVTYGPWVPVDYDQQGGR